MLNSLHHKSSICRSLRLLLICVLCTTSFACKIGQEGDGVTVGEDNSPPNTSDENSQENTPNPTPTNPFPNANDGNGNPMQRRSISSGAMVLPLATQVSLTELGSAISDCQTKITRTEISTKTPLATNQITVDFSGLDSINVTINSLAQPDGNPTSIPPGAPLCTGTAPTINDNNAIITIPDGCVDDTTNYILTATLEFSAIENPDSTITPGPEITVHAVLPGSSIIAGLATISPLSELVYQQQLSAITMGLDETDIFSNIAQATRSLIGLDIYSVVVEATETTPAINISPKVDEIDLFHWQSDAHVGALIPTADWYQDLIEQLLAQASLADYLSFADGTVSAPVTALDHLVPIDNLGITFTTDGFDVYCLQDTLDSASVYTSTNDIAAVIDSLTEGDNSLVLSGNLIGIGDDHVIWIEAEDENTPHYLMYLTLNTSNPSLPSLQVYSLQDWEFSLLQSGQGQILGNAFYFPFSNELLGVSLLNAPGAFSLHQIDSAGLVGQSTPSDVSQGPLFFTVDNSSVVVEPEETPPVDYSIIVSRDRGTMTVYDHFIFGENQLLTQIELTYMVQSIFYYDGYLFVLGDDNNLRLYQYTNDLGLNLVNTVADVGNYAALNLDTLIASSNNSIRIYDLLPEPSEEIVEPEEPTTASPPEPRLISEYILPEVENNGAILTVTDRQIIYTDAFYSLPFVEGFTVAPAE